jgi:hypothetical protein
MQILTTVSNFGAYRKNFTIEEQEFIFDFEYKKRTASWYVSLLSAEGEEIAAGRRLSPGWTPFEFYDRPPLPLGLFLVTGPNNYAKNDFGDRLLIIFVPENEIPPSQPLIEPPRVF